MTEFDTQKFESEIQQPLLDKIDDWTIARMWMTVMIITVMYWVRKWNI